MEEARWDFWESIGLHCAGYSSDTDEHLINVFIETGGSNAWYADIAKILGLDEAYVRLLIEILCSANFCEYGTSPRGAWAIQKEYENHKQRLIEWYEGKWETDFPVRNPA